MSKQVKEVVLDSEVDINQFDYVVYTDGACQRKSGEPLGSAAFLVFGKG